MNVSRSATDTDRAMMAMALQEARSSLDAGGVPVGAALAAGDRLLASGHNERVQLGDPIAHGEIACLRNAGRQPSYQGMTLYTTLSPCQMCSGAILLFQIPRVVIGEATTFAGDPEFLARHGVEVVLLDDEGCMAAMREFQERYPEVWSEDIGGR
ncbi:MAG TPA: tRNA-specific adenosine deaminase [Actinobacteria bacterium]|nr:tRNA-specific adenosine deaminase [Actinomycetota bacterium]